jgi:hypothetical protein
MSAKWKIAQAAFASRSTEVSAFIVLFCYSQPMYKNTMSTSRDTAKFERVAMLAGSTRESVHLKSIDVDRLKTPFAVSFPSS